jgi:hypothetical protein
LFKCDANYTYCAGHCMAQGSGTLVSESGHAPETHQNFISWRGSRR